MAHNLNLSIAAANVAMDAISPLLNGGFIDFYDGVQPASGDSAITTQQLLATLTLSNPAFGVSSAGIISALAIGADVDINATSKTTWARLYRSDHTSVVVDLSVGTTGCDINLNSDNLQIHAQLSLSALSLVLPR